MEEASGIEPQKVTLKNQPLRLDARAIWNVVVLNAQKQAITKTKAPL